MVVCLIIEGAYPYVNGGVSSWVQQLVQFMPDIEFKIQVISANRNEKKEFKYKIPDNVSEMKEVYLLDDDLVEKRKRSSFKLNKREYEAFHSLLFGKDVDWEIIFDFFRNNNVSTNALLSGKSFYDIVERYYSENYSRMIFTDFLWTMRSMYLPLFTILKGNLVKGDIYNSVSTGYAGIMGCMQQYIYQKPLIITEHGIYTREREEEIIKSSWVNGIYKDLWIAQFKKISTCCYDRAETVTSLFKEAKEFQVELGCPKNKTLVIPNGVKVEAFENLPGKSPDDKMINVGAVLRVTPIKDVKTIINAFAIAKQNDSRLKLWIMGSLEESPEYSKECLELVQELKVRDVEFTGLVDIKQYIGKMDFLLLSSISEGQPLSILEGFAAKKPYIVTNVGNCAGMINGEFDDYGSAGIVVPVMNVGKMAMAINELGKNEELRREMGEIAYKRAHQYTAEQSYSMYGDLYKSLYGGVN